MMTQKEQHYDRQIENVTENEDEMARVFGLQIMDACIQDIAYARFLLRKNHEKQKQHRRNLLKPTDDSYGRKYFGHHLEDGSDYGRAKSVSDHFIHINKAILAVSATTASGVTILHIMVYKDLWKQLQLLLEYGANPNLTNTNRETPLHWCAKLKSKRCTKTLLDHHSRIGSITSALCCVDESGSTPMHSAVAAGNLTLIPLIIDYLEVQNTAREHSTDRDDQSEATLAPSAPFLMLDMDQCTPLMVAVNSAKATAANLVSASVIESRSNKNEPTRNRNQYNDDSNVFVAIAVLLLRYHQQHDLPIPDSAYIISNSVTKSLVDQVAPWHNQSIDGQSLESMDWDSAVELQSNRLSDKRNKEVITEAPKVHEATQSAITTTTLDFLLQQLNEQQQILLEHRRLVQKTSPPKNSVESIRPQTAPKNEKPQRFRVKDQEVTPYEDEPEISFLDDIEPNNNFETDKGDKSRTPQTLPALSNKPNRYGSHTHNHTRSSSFSPEPKVNVTTTTAYERIAASYVQRNNRPKSSDGQKKITSISFKKAQQDMVSKQVTTANNSNTVVPHVNAANSPVKKPPFFIRKPDSLHLFPAPIVKSKVATDAPEEVDGEGSPSAHKNVLNSESGNHNIEHGRKRPGGKQPSITDFDAMSISSAQDQYADSSPPQGKAPFERRMSFVPGSKNMPALPSYETVYPPAPSVPFLPLKTRKGFTKRSMSVKQIESPLPAVNELSGVMAQVAAMFSSESNKQLYCTRRMDVIVAVEHCCDCETHSTQSLRHDARKYVQMANEVLYAVIEMICASNTGSSAVVDEAFPVRLFCMRTKPTSSERLGAFEVTVAVNITPIQNPPAVAAQQQLQPMATGRNGRMGSFRSPPATIPPVNEVEEETGLNSVWATHLVHSKLQTKSWPSVKAVQKKTGQFLSAVLNSERIKHQQQSSNLRRSMVMRSEIENFLSSALLADDGSKPSKLVALESSYHKWVERMRIPPKVERHALDLDWPTSLLSNNNLPSTEMESKTATTAAAAVEEKHSGGPYLDFSLLGKMSTEKFEDIVLRHFEVFDAT
mmetsp:Transcript_16865/g.23223  ORF Transcript_16865/g.23223 Transcript_16865/m.23223 type:complete len:1055 (+) Transcript_16865:34-3198(+)